MGCSWIGYSWVSRPRLPQIECLHLVFWVWLSFCLWRYDWRICESIICSYQVGRPDSVWIFVIQVTRSKFARSDLREDVKTLYMICIRNKIVIANLWWSRTLYLGCINTLWWWMRKVTEIDPNLTSYDTYEHTKRFDHQNIIIIIRWFLWIFFILYKFICSPQQFNGQIIN